MLYWQLNPNSENKMGLAQSKLVYINIAEVSPGIK
jgi:hypothetical protein